MILTVAAVSLLLRFVVLAEMRASNPMFRFALVDDAMYLQMAEQMHAGTIGEWLMAPLHAWVLALLGLVFPLGIGLACVSNALFGAATSAGVALLALRVHSRRAAWIAGLAHALIGGFIFRDIAPGQAPLLALLHVSGALLAVRLFREPRSSTAGLLGVVTGIATMGRGTSLAIAFAALPTLWREKGIGARARVFGAVSAGVLVVLLGASLRNLLVTDDFTPFHWNGGPNLYASNGPESRAITAYIHSDAGQHPAEIAYETRRIAQEAAGADAGTLTASEVSSYWVQRTMEEQGSFGEHALHFAKKAGLFLSSEEVGNIHSPLVESQFSVWLAWMPTRLWWVFPLGFAGWWLTRRRRPEIDVVLPIVVATWAALTLYFPVARMRAPVATLLLVPAAAGVVELLRADVRRRVVYGVIVAGFVLLAWLPYRRFDGEVGAHINLAEAHRGLGNDTALIEEQLHEALNLDPDSAQAHLLLARSLTHHDPDRALDHLTAATEDPAWAPSAWRASIRVYVELGDVERAEQSVHKSFSDDAHNPETLAYAAVTAHLGGNLNEAKRRLATARFYGPDEPAVLWALKRTGFAVTELDALIDDIRKAQ